MHDRKLDEPVGLTLPEIHEMVERLREQGEPAVWLGGRKYYRFFPPDIDQVDGN